MDTRFFSICFFVFCWGVKTGSSNDVRCPPSIVEPAFSTTHYYHRDSHFNVTCTATGHPRPTYKWQKDGRDVIDGMGTSTQPSSGLLAIDRMTSRHEGKYRCLASNKWGTSVSNVIHMVAIKGSKFVDTKSRLITKTKGEWVSLECLDPPKMTPRGVFSWHTTNIDNLGNDANAESVVIDNRVGVDETGTLHFAYLLERDQLVGEEYSCGIQNLESNDIFLGSKVQLTIQGEEGLPESKPRLVYSTQEKKAFIGKSTIMECFFSGNPIPDITWLDNNNEEIPANHKRFTISNFGRRLEIVNVTEEDEGLYRCRGKSKLDTRTGTTDLNVTSIPIWVQAASSQTVIEGSNVTFTCSARASRGEKLYSLPLWFKNWEQLPANDSRIDQNTFHLTSVSRDRDLMNIQCVIQNELGGIFKDSFLNILMPIQILYQPSRIVELTYGDSQTLSVSANTDPSRTLVFRWRKDGQDIPRTRPWFKFSHDNTNLTIDTSKVSEEDMATMLGLYSCIISHDIETVVVDVDVRESETKPVTEGIVNPKTASLSWWIIAVIAGVLLLIGSAFLIACVLRHRYPKRVYLLEKKELKSKLDPMQDLENEGFQTM